MNQKRFPFKVLFEMLFLASFVHIHEHVPNIDNLNEHDQVQEVIAEFSFSKLKIFNAFIPELFAAHVSSVKASD